MEKNLTFENGHFLLQVGGNKTIVALKAAIGFKNFADAKARKMLQRRFQFHYSPPALLPPFLDPHQVEGVKFILSRSRSYLAHAPGAGKTCQAIVASIFAQGPGQRVFVVPPNLTENWVREIEKFTAMLGMEVWPWASIAVVPESAEKQFMGWAAQFIIVPDSMLAKPWLLPGLIKMKKRIVVVDEASRFKEHTSERTLALFGGKLKDGKHSSGLVYSARHAVLMDGSPMPNRPMELWAPTYAMCPEAIDFMSRDEFGFKFCGATINSWGAWEFKHSSRETELKERLQKNFMHVVSEKSLTHPERRRSILYMSGDARSPAHKAWEKKNLGSINFDQIKEGMGQGDIARFRAELGLRKVPWVASYVLSRLAEKNEKILVFCWHREVAHELVKRLKAYNPCLVIGGVDAETRELQFQAFQKGASRVVVGNILAMGRGHNLQAADRAVFAEFSWSDEVNKQAEKRASRKGSTKDFIRCEYIVAPDSMDEPILKAVFRKAERVERIIGE